MIINGDSREILADMIERGETVHSIVTDPPYGLVSVVKRFGKEGSAPAKSNGATGVYKRASAGFMGQAWDGTGIEQDPVFWRLCYDVLLPGGHMLAFGGTRTWHRIACAIEDAGFEVRDCFMWLYGTGFPKSHDVSKGIDKVLGASGTFGGPKSDAHAGWINRGRMRGNDGHAGWQAPWMADSEAVDRNAREYIPGSDAARRYKGWGTALKPAWEPIFMFRKPLVGTVAQNVLAHGTGAMNIDVCRIEIAEGDDIFSKHPNTKEGFGHANAAVYGKSKGADVYDATKGRWPANLIGSDDLPQDFWRFFYTAKASKKDRNSDWQGNPLPYPNAHPTVKPTDLMQWLVRLVTPPGGTVLDPFTGSGSTGVAARREGFRFIGIEQDPRHADFAAMRVGGSDFEAKLARLREAIRRNEEARNGRMEE